MVCDSGVCSVSELCLMAVQVKGFGKAVQRWADKTDADLEDIIYTTLTDLSRRVIQRTPVGNPSLWKSPPPPGYTGGQAKGNWFASIGQPSAEKDLTIRARNAAKPLSRDAHIREAAIGETYYLTNNLPYIRRLEYEGWSGQAPEGMVRVTVTEFQSVVNKAIKRKFSR